jgi:hypothetical protein
MKGGTDKMTTGNVRPNDTEETLLECHRVHHKFYTGYKLSKRRVKLCKIWGFHGADYEEFRLLGYKPPLRTSQKTHYVSATESSRLMVCYIWGFHGADYE